MVHRTLVQGTSLKTNLNARALGSELLEILSGQARDHSQIDAVIDNHLSVMIKAKGMQ